MRRTTSLTRGIAMLGGLAASLAVGCSSAPDDCALNPKPGCEPAATTSGSGGSTASATSGTGGAKAPCAGDPTVDATLVREECGVFVRASAAAGGHGTKTSPYRSFAEAAAAADVKRIYACAEPYAETVPIVFTGGIEIYGGFTECDQQPGWRWTWTSKSKASVRGPADAVALTLNGGANHLVNLSVAAPAASVAGGSVIAMLVNGGSLDLSEGNIAAGDAMAGAAGMSPPADAALDGDAGSSGVGVCASGSDNLGPTGKIKSCPAGDGSKAGNGGDGGVIVMSALPAAGTGTDGGPPDVAQSTAGKGGIGEGQGAPSAPMCKDGTEGIAGAAGAAGLGASGAGAISAKDPYRGVAGASGARGKPGQGGGGGGGAKGGLGIPCGSDPANRVGASGGAGGTGGCGGAMGNGGEPGGSSIAIVALNATVTLSSVTLTAGKGGSGGKGGDGQSGGKKSKGGNPGASDPGGVTKASCRGGDGGNGGDGGPGGGGQGGHSLGIAFLGTTPPSGVTFTPDPLKAGSGGPGGIGNTTANGGKGAAGIAEGCWDFGGEKPCAP